MDYIIQYKMFGILRKVIKTVTHRKSGLLTEYSVKEEIIPIDPPKPIDPHEVRWKVPKIDYMPTYLTRVKVFTSKEEAEQYQKLLRSCFKETHLDSLMGDVKISKID